jgi:hypothetical protein
MVGSSISTIGTPLALNSNYLFGTSGAAMAGGFILPEDKTLTDFWFVASANSGTGSGDGNINWEIRSGIGRGVNNSPGPTLVASGTIACSGITADTWTKVTLGTPQALSQGVPYFLIIGDADGDATNYITIRTTTRGASMTLFTGSQIQTTDGWNTAGTASTYQATFALKFSNGFVCAGSPLRATAALGNNQVLRGVKITLAADGPALVWSGFFFILTSLGGWKAVILEGSALPSDFYTPTSKLLWQHTFNAGLDYSNSQGTFPYFFPEPMPRLLGGQTYYLLLKPDANTTSPAKSKAWSGMDADLRKLLSGHWGIDCVHVVEASSSSWTEDTDATSIAAFLMSIASQPTIAS